MLCWQLGELAVPVLIGVVIDEGIARRDAAATLLWLAALALVFLGFSNSYRFGATLAVRAAQAEQHELRLEIVGHVLRPTGAATDLAPGETLSLATSDTEAVGELLRSLGYAVAAVAGVVVTGLLLVRTDVVVALVVLLGVPLVLLLTQLVTPAMDLWSGSRG